MGIKDIFFAVIVIPVWMFANIAYQLHDGAQQLAAVARNGGSLDQILPKVQDMYDQIAAQQPGIHAEIKKNRDFLKSVKLLPPQIKAHEKITIKLRTSLLEAVTNLGDALLKLDYILNQLKNDVNQTVQERDTVLKDLQNKIQETKSQINSKSHLTKASLPQRMEALSKVISKFEKKRLKKAKNYPYRIS